MKKHKDLTGQRFGKLVAIKYITDSKWLCQCDCGNIHEASKSDLEKGKVKSCGCLRIDNSKYKDNYDSRLYFIWHDMIKRCYNVKVQAYNNYGARGIIVCEEWKENFINFYKWAMNNGYTNELTIDRKDVNGNYEPNNCRWITKAAQNDNRRNTVYTTINGITKTISQWARENNINKALIDSRLRHGWNGEELLSLNTKKNYSNCVDMINNEELTLKQISIKYNIKLSIIRSRYKRGDREERLIRKVQKRNYKQSMV